MICDLKPGNAVCIQDLTGQFCGCGRRPAFVFDPFHLWC